MSKLAKRYGLSDRGLAKICGRNDIPCPPRSYWAKKHSGRNVHRKPLPQKDIDQTIKIPANPLNACNSELKGEISLMKQRANPIVVQDNLRNPHRLVERSVQILDSCEPNSIGIIDRPLEEVIQAVNAVIRGWVNYFRIGNSNSTFYKVKYFIEKKVRRFVAKRKGMKGFGWKRWSKEEIYGKWGLYQEYRIRYLYPKAIPS